MTSIISGIQQEIIEIHSTHKIITRISGKNISLPYVGDYDNFIKNYDSKMNEILNSRCKLFNNCESS